MAHHTGIGLACKREKLAMAKFNVDEPLLSRPDVQSVVLGLQIVQQVCGLVIIRLVGHVRKIACG
ncbi:MAG: hypothetical protein DMG57_33155 [Acidobacteria bacterium]|nr:MAG: hypothetical protein DMG57_33155 [Acidobacteriota bacterium]